MEHCYCYVYVNPIKYNYISFTIHELAVLFAYVENSVKLTWLLLRANKIWISRMGKSKQLFSPVILHVLLEEEISVLDIRVARIWPQT
jgi:hypothetical protein